MAVLAFLLAASARLADAADMLNRTPAALQLRYMQTLTEIAVEKNSTIVFPLPIDILEGLLPKLFERNGRAPSGGDPAKAPRDATGVEIGV